MHRDGLYSSTTTAAAAVGMEQITIKLCNILTFLHESDGAIMKFHFELSVLFFKSGTKFPSNVMTVLNCKIDYCLTRKRLNVMFSQRVKQFSFLISYHHQATKSCRKILCSSILIHSRLENHVRQSLAGERNEKVTN